MIKANETIFNFYLILIDSLEKYLSKKYPKCNSSKDIKCYQTANIQKITKMFHSLELLSRNTLDEVSARCILRGILDNITTYSFIYQRDNEEEVWFRHYLYALDGFKEYTKNVLVLTKQNDLFFKEDSLCYQIIEQTEKKLYHHPFYKQHESAAKKIIKNARWNYESLENPRSLKYREMYALVGFESGVSEYFQSYLSQFVHGMCFSNTSTNSAKLKAVIYESIVLADKFIQVILQTFHDKEIENHLICPEVIQQYFDSIKIDDLAEFTRDMVRKEKVLSI